MTIQDYIKANLSKAEQEIALVFIEYLESNNLSFHKDDAPCWKNKIYYWATYKNLCTCFIAIKDPDEPSNNWTVWSDNIESNFLSAEAVDDNIKVIAFNHIDSCRCSGGSKTVFGKDIEWVCNTNFRFDNPTFEDLPVMKKMVDLKIKEIESKNLNK